MRYLLPPPHIVIGYFKKEISSQFNRDVLVDTDGWIALWIYWMCERFRLVLLLFILVVFWNNHRKRFVFKKQLFYGHFYAQLRTLQRSKDSIQQQLVWFWKVSFFSIMPSPDGMSRSEAIAHAFVDKFSIIWRYMPNTFGIVIAGVVTMILGSALRGNFIKQQISYFQYNTLIKNKHLNFLCWVYRLENNAFFYV